jgi:hypothetical protein
MKPLRNREAVEADMVAEEAEVQQRDTPPARRPIAP